MCITPLHQGIETFGSNLPEQDAEVIVLAWQILSQLGLDKNYSALNSISTDVSRSAITVKAFKNLSLLLSEVVFKIIRLDFRELSFWGTI